VLLCTSMKVFNTTPDHKGLLENFEGLPHTEDLKGDPILCRDGHNSNVGRVHFPKGFEGYVFTCFTGTKIQIRTHYEFTCCTGTNVMQVKQTSNPNWKDLELSNIYNRQFGVQQGHDRVETDFRVEILKGMIVVGNC
jgi:hypothetical protein